jgi:hypothetical protein
LDTKEEIEVRERLERSLSSRFMETSWSRLKAGGWVRDYIRHEHGYEDGLPWSTLRSQAEEELRYQKNMQRGMLGETLEESERRPKRLAYAQPPSGRVTIKLAPGEDALASARAVYAAELADKHPLVKWFRRWFLSDTWPLTEEQVWDLVNSHAAALFPIEWFEEWGIPLIGHWSWISGKYSVGDGLEVDHRATVWVDPPGIKKTIRYAHERLSLPPGLEIDRQTAKEYRSGAVKPPEVKFIFGGGEERRGSHYVWPESVLDVLTTICERLAKGYGWTDDLAARFLLAGVIPFVPPLQAKWRLALNGEDPQLVEHMRKNPTNSGWSADALAAKLDKAEIILNIEPWISPDRVRDVYQDIRTHMMGKKRQPWERNLEVYLFVKEKQRDGFDLSRLPSLWNKQVRREWRYAYPQGFWQAYRRAKQAVEDGTYHELEVGF